MVPDPNLETRPALPCGDSLEQQVIELYLEHAAGLCRYAASLLNDNRQAEDLAQETFLRFIAQKSLGCNIQNPRAWMYRVLRNLALDRLREVRRSNEVAIEQVQDGLQTPSSVQESMERRQIATSVREVLSRRELECVRFRSEGLRYDEIAAVLGIRTGTVGTLVARAYKKTRQVLDGTYRAARTGASGVNAMRMASNWYTGTSAKNDARG
jgi:RNA polymerase sigma-70 factor (ECF subfamily)